MAVRVGITAAAGDAWQNGPWVVLGGAVLHRRVAVLLLLFGAWGTSLADPPTVRPVVPDVHSPILAQTDDETVAFNVESLKYHCPSCRWAVRCTVNCINIPLSEAIRRGGIPCKTCGGSCR